jgi:CheY-like chemotaxis protein
MTSETVRILLVDDDAVDILAIKRSFQKLRIANPLIEAQNGVEALEHLRGDNGREKIAAPCLIVVDLNMPRMGGIEFLDELRRDLSLRHHLVFVMTTSAAEEDRIRAYKHNVAGYILKERWGENFIDAISMLEHYWRVIEFPLKPIGTLDQLGEKVA